MLCAMTFASPKRGFAGSSVIRPLTGIELSRTGLDMDSRGGYNTVDIRDEINSGRVQGPRLQVAGESLNPRATNYYPDKYRCVK